MMPLRLSRAAITALMLLSSATLAADAPEKADDTIVVSATVDREVSEFVDAVIDVSNFDRLTRFERAICPIAAGIPPAQKAAVVERMRAVAKAAGITVGKADCRPNVLVLVTADKKALITNFVDLYPGSMNNLSKSERRKLINSTEPAVAWHMKGPQVDKDGVEIGNEGTEVAINRTAGSASRLTSFARPQFAAAVVVIDSAELTGLSTTQLADYAAMRALLESDPAKLKGSNVPSILKILDAPDDADVPLSLTEWDLNALRGFYNVNRNTTVASQRSGVRKQVRDNAAKAKAEN